MWTGRVYEVFLVVCCVLVMTGWVGASETVVYVDAVATGAGDGASWADAYPYLQDALAAAGGVNEPVEIHVAQGTYKPDQGVGITPGDRTASFYLANGVELRGGYAGVAGMDPNERDPDRYITILSGDLNDDDDPNLSDQVDNSGKIFVTDPNDPVVVIDGFRIVASHNSVLSIEGGIATISNCTFEDHYASTIIGWNCRLVLTNCVFRNIGMIDPISCRGFRTSFHDFELSHVELTDCVFCENRGGINVAGTVDLSGCSFRDNVRNVVLCFGSVSARKCTFTRNRGGVVVISKQYQSWHPEMSIDCMLVDCEFVDNDDGGRAGAVFAEGDSLKAIRCIFSGNSSDSHSSTAGAIKSSNSITYLSNCIFVGNWSKERHGPSFRNAGAVMAEGLITQVSNCTFVSNRGQPGAINLEAGTSLTNCIVWDCPSAFEGLFIGSGGTITFSDVEGGYEGLGNIDIDPCFVDPGYWDANDIPDDETDDVWVAGDYHLKSQAGHWDSQNQDWVLDETSSHCIDAGDPNSPIDAEPFPNGAYVNLGAYGGTAQASRTSFDSFVCETQIAGDINGDCQVDDIDMDILLSHWLMPDIGRPNTPPTISIISPAENTEFSTPAPVVIQVEAADSDGSILRVRYTLIHRNGDSMYVLNSSSDDPTDNWALKLNWSMLSREGAYTVWAKAIDNEGAMTVSDPITIVLHP